MYLKILEKNIGEWTLGVAYCQTWQNLFLFQKAKWHVKHLKLQLLFQVFYFTEIMLSLSKTKNSYLEDLKNASTAFYLLQIVKSQHKIFAALIL